LSPVRQALDSLGLCPGRLQSRQQNRDQDSDDPDYNEQLDERESAA